jgi:aspartate aminotransferase-like enzyme
LALERATDNYMKEGRQAAFARHALFASAIRAGCTALGLELLVQSSAYSPTVTAVCKPEKVSIRDLQARLRDRYGVSVGGGQLRLEGRIFRIGNMGAIGARDILGAMGALELSLADLGVRVSPGVGAGAAEQVLAQQKLPELRAQALDDLKNARSEGGRETIASS